MNITSSSISVFPLAKNRTSDRSARLFYENNVANLIRQLIDVEGFIISKDELKLSMSSSVVSDHFVELCLAVINPLVFNLHGYYFNVRGNSIVYKYDKINASETTLEDSLYAMLRIDNITNEIIGFDNASDEYEGLHILTESELNDYISTATEDDNYHFIKLMDFKAERKSGSTEWVINGEYCNQSYQKISPKSVDMAINKIDGKH